MDINNSLIASDFNNDYLLSHLKINKKLKNNISSIQNILKIFY